jgi:hypothetical protein
MLNTWKKLDGFQKQNGKTKGKCVKLGPIVGAY